ncbi:MAG: flagellar assembly protein FliH [Gammaproteobacteria bacterium]
MSKIISGNKLTAYQRWEMPAMEPEAGAASAADPLAGTPGAAAPTSLQALESIERQAQEEGFAAGYQEGRKEGREQGFAKGQQEGQQEGFRKGYQEGLAAGQDEIAKRVQALAEILEFMNQPLAELDGEVEQELVHLTVAISRQLIRRELKTSPGEIIAVVREAIRALPVASQNIRLHLHPEDARLVQDILSVKDEGRGWRIQEDASLSRGGCRVDTDASRIDATVEKRLGAVIATVLGSERRHD